MENTEQIAQQVQRWVEEVVVGLNLCPFARQPLAAQQVKIAVVEAAEDAAVLQAILDELSLLQQTPAQSLETTLLVVPRAFADFNDYNQFLDWTDHLLEQQGWSGVFQIASFHPDYCFEGCAPDDVSNLTNRSPYPIFHLLREASLERAIANLENPEAIPERNIRSMRELTDDQRRRLFPYLSTPSR
ncbi:DUF1415 domain-containing protein [Pseudomaricurvus alkylphenolicus]|uniref:DUF1415 domain-containing protein n=1 Tax=Pseudomaricurvus alkylphenolicus TaxID=1306991 RepID=UPI00141F1DCB|nr:DUF1415 domain-containing protein [Pseudomaricurvus alkylphenolicus]NIB44572.1 DUF1415 domain-containing protein [Pseudomaricurvus alkylphenolicus]